MLKSKKNKLVNTKYNNSFILSLQKLIKILFIFSIIMIVISSVIFAIDTTNIIYVKDKIELDKEFVIVEMTDSYKEQNNVYIKNYEKFKDKGFKLKAIIDPDSTDDLLKNDLKITEYSDHVSVLPGFDVIFGNYKRRIRKSDHKIRIELINGENVYFNDFNVHLNEINMSFKNQSNYNNLALLPGEETKIFKYKYFEEFSNLGYKMTNIDYDKNNKIFSVENITTDSFKINKLSIGKENFSVTANSNIKDVYCYENYNINNKVVNKIVLDKDSVNLSIDSQSDSITITNYENLINDGYEFDKDKIDKNVKNISIDKNKIKINYKEDLADKVEIAFKNTRWVYLNELVVNINIINYSVKGIKINNNTNDFDVNNELGEEQLLTISNYAELIKKEGKFIIEKSDTTFADDIYIEKDKIHIKSNLPETSTVKIIYKRKDKVVLNSGNIILKNIISNDTNKVKTEMNQTLDYLNNINNFNNNLLVSKYNESYDIWCISKLIKNGQYVDVEWKNKDTNDDNTSFYKYIMAMIRVLAYSDKMSGEDLEKLSILTFTWSVDMQIQIQLAEKQADGNYTKAFSLNNDSIIFLYNCFEKNYKIFAEEIKKINVSR